MTRRFDDERPARDHPRASGRRGSVDFQRHGPGVLGIVVLSLIVGAVFGLPFWSLFLTGLFASWALRGAKWAWIPAALFGWDVVAHAGGAFTGARLPVLFIVAGGLVIARDHIWDPIWKISMIVVGVLILGALFGGRHDHRPRVDRIVPGAVTTRARTTELPSDLGGRKLVVQTNSGHVKLVNGDHLAELSTSPLLVSENETSVTVRADGESFTLAVPASAAVEIDSNSGDTDAVGSWEILDIRTNSGDEKIVWTGDPTVDLTTASGRIDLVGLDGSSSRHSFHHAGAEGRVDVKTNSGDVDFVRVPPSSSSGSSTTGSTSGLR